MCMKKCGGECQARLALKADELRLVKAVLHNESERTCYIFHMMRGELLKDIRGWDGDN